MLKETFLKVRSKALEMHRKYTEGYRTWERFYRNDDEVKLSYFHNGIDPQVIMGALGGVAALVAVIEPFVVQPGEAVVLMDTGGAVSDELTSRKWIPHFRIRRLQVRIPIDKAERTLFIGEKEDLMQGVIHAGEPLVINTRLGDDIGIDKSTDNKLVKAGGAVKVRLGFQARIGNGGDILRAIPGQEDLRDPYAVVSLESAPEIVQALRSITYAVVRDVIKDLSLDEALTYSSDDLGSHIQEHLQKALDNVIIIKNKANARSAVVLQRELGDKVDRRLIDVGIIVDRVNPVLVPAKDEAEGLSRRQIATMNLQTQKKVLDILGEKVTLKTIEADTILNAAQEGAGTVITWGGDGQRVDPMSAMAEKRVRDMKAGPEMTLNQAMAKLDEKTADLD